MRSIRHYVDRQAREQPDAPFLIAPETGRTLTYAKLKARSESLGRYLLARGLSRADKVAFMLHNGCQAARLLIGTMYAGFTVAPPGPLNLTGGALQALTGSATGLAGGATLTCANSSTNTSVATVQPTGCSPTITAVGQGSATVTVTATASGSIGRGTTLVSNSSHRAGTPS